MNLGLGLSHGPRLGSSSPAFVPTDIANAWWLEAGRGLSAGPVTTWSDQGPNVHDAGGGVAPGWSASGGPNSLAAVTFDGTQYLDTGVAVTGGTNWTLFVVLKTTSLVAPQFVVNVGGTTDGYAAALNFTAGKREIFGNALAIEDEGGSATTSWEAWTLQGNGASQSMRVNGADVTIAPNDLSLHAPGAHTFVGSRSGSFGFRGSLWLALAYPATLSPANVAKVEHYISLATLIF